MTHFSRRIHEALDYATYHHRRHRRKDADIKIPYASHLFGVAYIIAQHDFDEDVVVAAILHDFIEDVVDKGRPHLEADMKARFGERVHALVRCVTQNTTASFWREKSWHDRRVEYLKVMTDPVTPNEARAISCADKIHNIESLLMALERMRGSEHRMWRKMRASPKEQLHKFQELHQGISAVWEHPLVDEFGRKVEQLAAVLPQ